MFQGKRMTACLAAAVLWLTAAGTVTPAAATGTVADDLAQTRQVWDFGGLPAGVALGESGDTTPWAEKAQGHNDAYHITAAAGKGYDGGPALAWQAVKDGGTQAAYLNWRHDADALTDWTGAEEVWLYVDCSTLSDQTDVRVDLYATDADGERWETFESGDNTDGTYYYQDGTTWKSAALNEWGHTVLPAQYTGWVRYPLTAEMYNLRTGGGNGTPDLYHIQQVGVYVEYNNTATGGQVYVSSLRIAGEDIAPLPDELPVINQGVSQADARVLRVDDSQEYQTIQGFGASGCWWAATWSNFWSESMIDKALEYLYDDTKGIGLNTYRYNVGGGTTFDDTIRSTICIETSPGVFDVSLDADNIAVLDKVLEYDIDRLTLFMNSPPARLTVTGDTKGNPTGENNLAAGNEAAYAAYSVGVAKAFLDAGYPVTYLSPINEPDGAWSEGSQEGCHYDDSQVLDVSRRVAALLEEQNLPVKLSLAEFTNWADAYRMLQQVLNDDDLLPYIDHYAAHSYGGSVSHKQRIAALAAGTGLDIVQSEWGQTDTSISDPVDSALHLANMVHDDLAVLGASVWEFWLGVERDTPWPGGLVYLRNNGNVEPAKRLWALGNYSRFIIGSTRVDVSGSDDTVAVSAYTDAAAGTTTLVLVNNSEQAETIAVSGAGDYAQVYTTDATRDLAAEGRMTSRYGYVLPAQSVTTLVFGNDAVTPGDVNADGKVTVSDVRQALRAVVGKTTLTSAQQRAADWNGDGKVSTADVRQILRKAVGKI